jgi:hypothetical protein
MIRVRNGPVEECLNRIAFLKPMNSFFSLPTDRTDFSDAIYSAIGRGLASSTQFEANCRSLALLVGIKERVISDASFSLSKPEDLDALVNDLQKKRLFDQITAVCVGLGIDSEIRMILQNGRVARNALVHELTLGLEHQGEKDVGRDHYLDHLRRLMKDVALANLVICLFSLLATGEPLPTMDFISQYSCRAVDWVCDVSDSGS